MWITVIGSLGFLLYFAYDMNSITMNNRLLQKGFFAGTVLVAFATAGIFAENWSDSDLNPIRLIAFGAAGLVLFALLVYTLFFALPFEATYMEKNQKRSAYTEGVYALCRHPGVLWYAGMYLCIAGMLWTKAALLEGLFLTAWNVAYIVMQDLVIFPATFDNYDVYKRTTPFLIPNRSSVRRCFETLQSSKRES